LSLSVPRKEGKGLHRFAVVTAVSTFVLIIAGGLVTSTGSALSVPDWPLSYGQLMPPMVGGILYEHGHRMVATFVGFLTTILAIWLWKSETRKWMRVLGLVAIGGIILQGIFGGLTVLFLLPTPISVTHATLAQTFFCVVCAIALFTSPWWKETRRVSPTISSGRISFTTLTILTASAVYVQLILGALMRHTDSGLAIPDVPLAYGQFFPSLSPEALSRYNEILMATGIREFADGPITASQIVIQLLHRYWACVVSVFIFRVSVCTIALAKSQPRLRVFAFALPLLIVTQIILGLYTVLSLKAVPIATAHVATGALLLVTTVLLALHSVRMYGFAPRRAAHRFEAEGVPA
jgi:cytochrome c oxidase assembly protein subunit 15